MQLGDGGEYSLLVHHSREELLHWGLSPDMIVDQEFRKTATRGDYSDQWPWSGTQFFDHFNEAEAGGRINDTDSEEATPKDNNSYASPDAQTPLDMLGVENNAEGEGENPNRLDQQLE